MKQIYSDSGPDVISGIVSFLKFIGILSLVLLVGCAGIKFNFGGTAEPCTICEEMEIKYPENTSLICERIPNPCQAQDVIVAFAKAGVIWEAWKVDDFKSWTQTTRVFVATGTSYKALNDYVTAAVAKYNKKMGGTYLLISELLLDFQDTSLIDKADTEMLLLALDTLDSEIERYRILE